MVKYIHCEMCNKIYSTETWIGEAHIYDGLCASCIEQEPQENHQQEKAFEDHVQKTYDLKNSFKTPQLSPLEIERDLLSNLERRAYNAIFGEDSIHVLIKDIKDILVDKAKENIREMGQKLDSSKVDFQKFIMYTGKTSDYLSDYKDYIINLTQKLHEYPSMKVEVAIEKVFKEIMATIPKNIAKGVLHDKKAIFRIVHEKIVKWYNMFSNIEDIDELIERMALHPFNEIQRKFSTLSFYNSD